MDIRNVQRTGNMFYVYLPTSWCRKHKISSSSKVGLNVESDGTLSIMPEIRRDKGKTLQLNISEESQSIVNKLIVACYINPALSFKITLDKEVEVSKLLDQKKLISVELVEFDGKNISCECPIYVEDPLSLLKTMTLKIKNMLHVMTKGYPAELLERYEEEIDRSKLLINKSVVGGLTFVSPTTQLRNIDLHYIDLIAKDLEKMVDDLLQVSKSDTAFFREILGIITFLGEIIALTQGKERPTLDHTTAAEFIRRVEGLDAPPKNHYKNNIKNLLLNISEVILDWAITIKLV